MLPGGRGGEGREGIEEGEGEGRGRGDGGRGRGGEGKGRGGKGRGGEGRQLATTEGHFITKHYSKL